MRFMIPILTMMVIAGVMTGIAGASISTGEITPVPTATVQPVIPTVTAVQPVITEQPFTTPSVVPTQLPAPGSQQGYFSINSVPSGADCYFDGSWQGETPVVVTVSTTGNPKHAISLSLEGYESYSTTYNGNPGPGQTIPITATLVPSPQVGMISVSSSPTGANAILDDQRTGYTPTSFSNVPVGSHSVQVYLSGYQTYYTTVNVQKGQTASVYATLSPIQTIGSLSITSSPSGASVYVDGYYEGVTPATVGNLQAGSHTVLLEKAGYRDWSTQITISAGETMYLSPTLSPDPQPMYATVSLVSNPSGASVYSNGVYKGKTVPGTPLVSTQVLPGTYTLLLTKSGYQDYTTTGTVLAGRNYDITANLVPVSNPTTGAISVSSVPTGANVYLNNAFKGLAPITMDTLTPGAYTVLVRLSGYQDWQASVSVTAGQTAPVSAVLIPAAIQTRTPEKTPTPVPTRTTILPVTAVIGFIAAAGFFLPLRKK